jgi:hypothetical protein
LQSKLVAKVTSVRATSVVLIHLKCHVNHPYIEVYEQAPAETFSSSPHDGLEQHLLLNHIKYTYFYFLFNFGAKKGAIL